ncbi:MAG: amidohydrolase [Xanthomonadales bacterium]|nr:amidohydrolase [Gammaproteobacteria bacterium]NNK04855.1 amidohydrolase [Xanthomonadales bacterium]
MTTKKSLQCLLVQTQLFWADPEANRRQLETIVRQQGAGCDLVVFPETFTSGFLGDAEAEPETMQGETVAWMTALASELGSVLCGSAAISTSRGNANRFLWVQPDGEVAFYDKRHLFSFGGEDQRYAAGRERKVFSYRGWRICPQICYDLRFPVWCRNRDDYDLLLFVANWPEPRTAAWTALMRARAIENQCYVIGVNRCGKDPRGLEYSGRSAVYDPLGDIVIDLATAECNATATITLDKIQSVRSQLPFQQDADGFSID